MAPPTSFTKTTLSYPIVAASFDPYRNYLVVGGGGGAGRSGVGNKITVLDTSSRSEITTVAEIELSRDEDAVTSVANLAQKDGIITFAGINSSETNLKASNNEHFRSFAIDLPKKTKSEAEKASQGKIELLGKARLFTPPTKENAKKDAYQRILRLTRPKKNAGGSKRIGAIATSLGGDENEVVVFNATVAQPSSSDIIQKINPPKGVEANDIDILEVEETVFRVAYCTDDEVHVSEVKYDFGKKTTADSEAHSRTVYAVPSADASDKKRQPKIRSIRWLSPTHILLLVNLPNKSGVELRVLRLYSLHTAGTIISSKKLAGHVKSAVDLDTSELDEDENGARQVVIAVAGADISLSVFTIDYRGVDKGSFSSIHPFTVLRDLHPFQITKVVISPFHSPWPADLQADKRSPPPQYLRIASTSFANTVVVDTFSLIPLHASKPGSRYILYTGGSDLLMQGAGLFVLGFVALIGLLLFQSYINSQNGGEDISLLPGRIQSILSELRPAGDRYHQAQKGKPIVIDTDKIPIAKVRHTLRDLLPHRRTEELHGHLEDKAIVVTSSDEDTHDFSTEIHHDPNELEEDDSLRRWEELTRHEKEQWKKRLSKAGQWSVEEGEKVLKGVFFGELAGFVGRAAAEAMRG